MDEYIEREAAVKMAESYGLQNGSSLGMHSGIADYIAEAISIIPAADVALVRHGRWIERGYVCGENEYQCSQCKETEWRTSASRLKYCPFCGAKMDGGATNAQT